MTYQARANNLYSFTFDAGPDSRCTARPQPPRRAQANQLALTADFQAVSRSELPPSGRPVDGDGLDPARRSPEMLEAAQACLAREMLVTGCGVSRGRVRQEVPACCHVDCSVRDRLERQGGYLRALRAAYLASRTAFSSAAVGTFGRFALAASASATAAASAAAIASSFATFAASIAASFAA